MSKGKDGSLPSLQRPYYYFSTQTREHIRQSAATLLSPYHMPKKPFECVRSDFVLARRSWPSSSRPGHLAYPFPHYCSSSACTCRYRGHSSLRGPTGGARTRRSPTHRSFTRPSCQKTPKAGLSHGCRSRSKLGHLSRQNSVRASRWCTGSYYGIKNPSEQSVDGRWDTIRFEGSECASAGE